MEHTHTPWKYSGGRVFIDDDIMESDICNCSKEVNAAHIVKCANMHDDLARIIENVPDPSKKFNMGELNEWNKDPGNLSVKDVSRLICYLNDSWYANLQIKSVMSK